jgi:hypothetical protein
MKPILDVDQLVDLALGGNDHPANIVALCPNCHACKTRGADVRSWRTELTQAVRAARQAALRWVPHWAHPQVDGFELTPPGSTRPQMDDSLRDFQSSAQLPK